MGEQACSRSAGKPDMGMRSEEETIQSSNGHTNYRGQITSQLPYAANEISLNCVMKGFIVIAHSLGDTGAKSNIITLYSGPSEEKLEIQAHLCSRRSQTDIHNGRRA
jgi:hypothetical protein